ncbi:tRNA (N(6)-L-threonylcarbamoyladenosine(37)-C(2))-methylthiotransferase MtaB [Pelotomaculum propionicicum]|uniref:tRNA (N(6)-L-threonylcarbamoyladenosine(37)-C(2))- methylthiotransferase MtaB n=1 Tax=Pelotomaculum propionicicum TaxID=258475 RepID=UPI003B81167A
MTKKRVAVYTLGCKVNQYESASLAGLFQERGYQVVDFAGEADVYIINTCTVTHLGDRKSRQLIRRAAKANPDAVVAVTGCYAQVSPGEIVEIPGVDLVVGTRDRAKLVDLVEKAVKGRAPVNAVSEYADGDAFEEIYVQPIQGRVRAFLKIQEGCSNFCTYCIVPYARGPLRSRDPGRVIDAARKLVASGYKEIVLTGIHTGAYGVDLDNGITLAGLLKSLLDIPGLVRLRLSSIEPHDITLELVDIMSGSEIFCRHLHVPLQSGNDEVLRMMGRRYTSWEYLRLVDVLKENIPGLGLTTDVMVGFPGESEEYFQSTLELIKRIGFSGLHVFKFSPRERTPAACFDRQVEPALKDERSRKLIQLGKKLTAQFARSHLGQDLSVLAEQPVQDAAGYFEGHTDNYIKVVFPGTEGLAGQIVRVKAEKVKGTIIEGRIIDQQDEGFNC